MPKKGTGAGGSKKVPIPAAPDDDDGSFVVFGNGKGNKDKQKAEPSSKGRGNEAPSVPDAPKKPDTRQLIGGASWTGKLPMNLLSELCQKQKWSKPEYTMVMLDHCIASLRLLTPTLE